MRVCVVGGGPSGLACIKACKEENIDVVCYEKSRGIGGLWNYNEEDLSLATVARSTIINSSKEMSAYTDFVPPADYPNFMHNTMMLKYFELYADKFDLRRHVVFRMEVIKVKEADDHDLTGKWTVSTKNLDTNEVKSEVFDSVMICTGHHGKPLWPKFKGQEKFKGKLFHTHSYKKPDGFERKKVVVVGVGNSGGDCCAELSTVAEKVYLSTRRGCWVMNRMSPGGLPIDGYLIRRSNNLMLQYLPNLASAIFENLIEARFDHELYGLKPKHRVFSQHPTVNDSLPNRILSGTVAVKDDIDRFEEDGVVFKGENQVTKVDAVCFATGYEIDFPFLDKRIIDTKDNKANLYKLQYVPELRHPHTLAFIGLMQPFGPLVNISESQARWHVQLLKKQCAPLPQVVEMLEDIDKRNKTLAARYYKSKRHTIQVDVVEFMDEINKQYGAAPNLLEILYTDPALWYRLVFHPSLPYQYRLNGPHSDYQTARENIMTYENRIKAALKTNNIEYEAHSLMKRIGMALFSIWVFVLLMLFK